MDNQNPDLNKNNKPKKGATGMKPGQSITLWIVLFLLALVIYFNFTSRNMKVKDVTYSSFISMLYNGDIKAATFNDQDLYFTNMADQKFHTYLPYADPDLVKEMINKGINISSSKPSQMLGFLLNILPFVIFLAFWFFIMRSAYSGGNKAFSFGKSRAKLAVGGKTFVTFKDVAGVDEAKEELEEIVDFLKAPKKFQKLGGRIPRGVLLLGRPGTGKTLLAKAVAGEAKVPFYSISGSDFVEMFVGVGASRVRDMFAEAKRNAPCIAFIDEIDAVGRHRGTGVGGGHDEREQTLNQLLVEMDGFDPNDSVIIIAATNRPDVLDPALLRPGRFDRQVVVDLPDIKGREEILRVHTRKLPISKEVNLAVIARITSGFSGADLANLANEAALLAARKEKKKIEMDDFDEAKDKVTLGKARKSKVITEDDKRITSVHEVGHVLCSMFLDKVEPIHKVTIIPRGFTGGATHFLQTDKGHYTKTYMLESIVGLLGGRAAEEIVYSDISTGASNDIERASDLARRMVCNWGMSEKIGPQTVSKKEAQVFLGRDISQTDVISEQTAQTIDNEIRTIIMDAYDKAKTILTIKKDLLLKMSESLLEKETLELDEIFEIVREFVTDAENDIIEKKYKMVKEIKREFERKTEELREKEKLENKSTEDTTEANTSDDTEENSDQNNDSNIENPEEK